MLDAVDQSLVEADVVLCLVDPTRPCGAEDDLVARRVAACGKPAVLILNKGDVTDEVARAAAEAFYRERLRPETPVRQLTALTGEGVEPLVAWLREQMPIAPFLFPPDQAMDAVERELGAELIREAALHLLRDEVPHALTVSILRWQDGEKKVKIDAELYVERPTQKAILIGKGGTMIAAIRSAASKLLHQWLERRVTLCLHVKVAEDWRNQANFLREQGLLPPADED
jgi:GTP-binding protein Era